MNILAENNIKHMLCYVDMVLIGIVCDNAEPTNLILVI